MTLPRAEDAVVPQAKVEDYLLNPSHPVGGGKANFFLHFGFLRDDWQRLAEALRRHALVHPVAESVSDADGATTWWKARSKHRQAAGPASGPFGCWKRANLHHASSPLILWTHDQGTGLRGTHR